MRPAVLAAYGLRQLARPGHELSGSSGKRAGSKTEVRGYRGGGSECRAERGTLLNVTRAGRSRGLQVFFEGEAS